jgi:hypothetical protein
VSSWCFPSRLLNVTETNKHAAAAPSRRTKYRSAAAAARTCHSLRLCFLSLFAASIYGLLFRTQFRFLSCCVHLLAAAPMEQPQFAAWAHYAEAGESSWHKRWISLTQNNLHASKSDKPGTKQLFSFSLSSIVAKKLASSFERRHCVIVFTFLRNFIISFSSQTELELAMSIITRVQESVSGCVLALLLLLSSRPPCTSGVDLTALTAGGAAAATEITVSGASGSSSPQTDPSLSLTKHLAKERNNRSKLFAQAAAGASAEPRLAIQSLACSHVCSALGGCAGFVCAA